MADKIKLIVAILILCGGLVAFYMFPDFSLLGSVVGLLVLVGISVSISVQTEVGRIGWSFLKDARIESRKVVWPTRKETIQTTLIVIVMVIIVGIILWLLDMFLVWAVQLFTGMG